MVDEAVFLYKKRIMMIKRFIDEYSYLNEKLKDKLKQEKQGNICDVIIPIDEFAAAVDKTERILEELNYVPKYAWVKLPMGH